MNNYLKKYSLGVYQFIKLGKLFSHLFSYQFADTFSFHLSHGIITVCNYDNDCVVIMLSSNLSPVPIGVFYKYVFSEHLAVFKMYGP